ncbi:hypothetical protein SAMN05660649_00455 [Desulfotomaculum arcticum]|uniref:Uncharacterized protein n=1 Tax=Desulfotruncus arcticus DSM 17038 TaxID=1121424 RepID=A0A1I2NBI2_9FIRM|nr:hypothetical protein SAMN05660649_00455 [Desulfotomaculum arcticum] [Desulfotruncus arcticus DSM 17038]
MVRRIKNLKAVSQVQNRTDAEEIGEEVLRNVNKSRNDITDFQLNEAGGPLGEEFDEAD